MELPVWLNHGTPIHMSHIKHTNTSHHITCNMMHVCVWHECVCVTWMCVCVTWRMYMRDMICSYLRPDSFMCVTWLVHICDMTHSYVWHTSFICVTWLIHVDNMTQLCVWHASVMCVTRLIYMCVAWLVHVGGMTHLCVYHDSFYTFDMTHPYVGHDVLQYAKWLIHLWVITHSYMLHDSFIYVTWLIHMRHDSFICATQCDLCIFVKWTIRICHVYVWHDSSKKKKFSCIYVTWLIYMTWLLYFREIMHSHLYLSHVCMTWIVHMYDMVIYMYDMTHSYLWHDSFIRVTWLIHIRDMTQFTWNIIRNVSNSCVSRVTFWYV